MMKPPFKLPLRFEDMNFLVAADCELVGQLADATPEESQYLLAAANAYPVLLAIAEAADKLMTIGGYTEHNFQQLAHALTTYKGNP